MDDANNGGPRVQLPRGGTSVTVEAAADMLAYVYQHAPGVWANAALTVFAPGYKATKQANRQPAGQPGEGDDNG